MISDESITNYKELKRLANNRCVWRDYGKLQNHTSTRVDYTKKMFYYLQYCCVNTLSIIV